MKIHSTLTAAALAMLLASPAFGDDDGGRHGRGHDRDDRHDRRDDDRRYDNHRDDHWRRDGWRDDRHWRYVPPVHYRADFGYRSGYELAWRDWTRYGRHDYRWRRAPSTWYRADFGYRSGYEEGWRDAARYYGAGYRPRYWAQDPRDGWFFSFGFEG
jgi:hypothetical protein